MFSQITDQLVTTWIFYFVIVMISVSSGNSNWLQECNICHCHWISGRRAADCKNKTLTQVPKEMSTELQVIDLSNNLIPEIHRDEFLNADLLNLHKLYMRNCTLQNLNRNSLKGLALLIELDLSNNFIQILYSGTFSGLTKLRILLMNNNEIETLENYLFKDLMYLQKIEFKHNRIKRIETNTFVNLPSLMLIYLDANRLSILKKETFENIPKLKDLSLAQNPWNCSCELQPFRDFAMTHKLYTPPTNCHEPLYLRGKLWSDISVEDFACRPKIIHPEGIRYPYTLNTGTTGTGTLLEAISENITLVCCVRSSPKPDITWIYNKRAINLNDQRLHIRTLIEPLNRKQHQQHHDSVYGIFLSKLFIYGVKVNDKGVYTCVAENRAGKDEINFQLTVNIEQIKRGTADNFLSNVLLIICIAALTLVLILIVIAFVLCCCCSRIRQHYVKDNKISKTDLISTKVVNKLENGTVIIEDGTTQMMHQMVHQKTHRANIEATIDMDGDVHEIKSNLIG